MRELVLETGERFLSVDENLEVVSVARRRLARAPEPVVRRLVGARPAVAFQAAVVVRDDEPFEPCPDCVVQPVGPSRRHMAASVSAQTPERAR